MLTTATNFLLLLAVALFAGSQQPQPAAALECYVVDDGIPGRTPSSRTQVCQHEDHGCFEYEANPLVPPVYRLAYFAGCSRPDLCHVVPNIGNYSVCSTDKCNTQLLESLMNTGRVCYSYFASYDKLGAQEVLKDEVVCPSGETECFQVHYPAGSAYSAWTHFTGGCGSKQHGCTREFNYTWCKVCSENRCNLPAGPVILASDQAKSAVALTPRLTTVAGGFASLALLAVGASSWVAQLSSALLGSCSV